MVFLTGREDIERCAQELMDMAQAYVFPFPRVLEVFHYLSTRLPPRAMRLTILPLHAGLTTEEQMEIFRPAGPGHRKVIVSTNIAEVRRSTHSCFTTDNG